VKSRANDHTAAEEARQFFLQRIQQQAASEGQPLSELEVRYLDYSRIVSDKQADRLEEEFESKYDSDDFSDRISRLVEAALKPGPRSQFTRPRGIQAICEGAEKQ